MIKKFSYLFVIAFIFLNFVPTVLAQNDNLIDFSKKGSIAITLKESESKAPISGVEITIYKVASMDIKDNNLIFNYASGFENCNVSLDNLNNENLASSLEKCMVASSALKFTETTSTNGTVSFNNLDLGIYQVIQTKEKEGYSKIASFLVMIPENINNKWTYDIIAEPKTSIFEVMDLTIRKVWNNTILEITDKVTVSLLKGEDVIETVELNPDNNWTYTFENIEKSDDYSVLEVNVPTGYVATYQENNNIFTITNTDKLVQTGQNKILLLSLAIIGLILLIVGLLFEKRKKYE